MPIFAQHRKIIACKINISLETLNKIASLNMQTVTSKKIQSNFREVAEIAKSGEPVTITQYGRPTLLLMRYQDGVSVLQELAKQKMVAWMDCRKSTAPISAMTVSDDELNDLINEEIKK